MKLDDAGLDFIKGQEGYSALPYQDAGGVWTNGYGNTHGVSELTGPITERQAEWMLLQNIIPCERAVNQLTDKISLTQNQYTALVDFAFNEGCSALLTSELAKKIVSGDIQGASKEFARWKYYHTRNSDGTIAVHESEDLIKRRAAEAALFLRPDSRVA